ncbi:DUF3806 domain-containing protein [Corynebacterium callunae]|uniref:DUF3806 domain-containing protein n=1 Tax=Corynebacterium callunae TaxID=1721 RepID=UPI003981BFD7
MDIQQLDADTNAWKDSLLRTAQEAGFTLAAPQIYQDFETTVEQYKESAAQQPDLDVTDLQQMFGVVVGEFLRQEIGMDWAVITDDYGTDLAIIAEAKDGSHVYSCPIVVVGKRFSPDYEKGQLESFCNQFIAASKARLQAR